MDLLSVIASSRRRLDPLVVAYAAESGATDLTAIDTLIKYVRSQSLLDNFRLYPGKAAQNAGTGTTLYGIGSLTANNGVLVNGPTWGASGISFVGASSHYATISDFIGSETLNVFCRTTKTDEATGDTLMASQYDFGDNNRSWYLAQRGSVTGDPIGIARSSDGTSANLETYHDAKTGLGADTCYVAQWIDGGGRSLWANKTALSLTLVSGTAQTSRFNTAKAITISALLVSGSPVNYGTQTVHAIGFANTSLTTEQREAITDLINAL